MASKLRDTDLFIIERSQFNYRMESQDMLDYVEAIPPGTKVLFNNTTAPLGWTKDTTAAINNTHIRVVSSNGGRVETSGSAFTDIFKSISIKVAKHKHGTNEGNHSHSASLANHTHGLSDPGHGHSTSRAGGHGHTFNIGGRGGGNSSHYDGSNNRATNRNPVNSNPADDGGGGAISAAATGVSINSGTASGTSGNNTSTGVTIRNAGSATNWNFAIRYNDCIICSKDSR